MTTFLRALGRAVVRDAIDDAGAMMAYYAILAIFPLLLCVVTLAVLVLPTPTIAEGIGFALGAAPSNVRSLITDQVEAMAHQARAGFAVGTVLFAVWGASRGASGLMLTLNRLFGRTETRSWWHRQAIAIALTLGVAVVLVIALALLVAGPQIGEIVADRLGLGGAFHVVWAVGRWVVAGMLVMVVSALAHRFLPDTDAPFRIFTPGAFAGVVLWLVISRLFALFLDELANYTTVYGALGGAVIFLTWLWLSSIAMLLGAEINAVLARADREPLAREGPAARSLCEVSYAVRAVRGHASCSQLQDPLRGDDHGDHV